MTYRQQNVPGGRVLDFVQRHEDKLTFGSVTIWMSGIPGDVEPGKLSDWLDPEDTFTVSVMRFKATGTIAINLREGHDD